MAIVHTRIDNKLIHGQVAMMWTNNLKTSRIMVVDDEAALDEMLKMALKLATPSGVSLSVLSVDKAAENINSGRYDGQRVMIIIRNPKTLRRLVEKNVSIDSCNAGNMVYQEGKITISPTVAITKEEAYEFIELDKRGVKLTLQLIPSNPAENLLNAMYKAFKEKGIEL